MQLSIKWEDIAKTKKLFLATPMYGGQCHGMYARSVADLAAICAKRNIQLQIYYLFNESLITRGRNYACDEFMRSDCTHMMFIDSDIGFNAMDVIALLAMMDKDSEYDVHGSCYPKKCISWEKIKMAVDKGFADKNPNVLENFVGDFVFNPKAGHTSIAIKEPAQVMELGTGFMMIQRHVFEKFKEAYPEKSYLPDHVRTENFDGSREIIAYFDCQIEPETKRYLSEDYNFCYLVQKIGCKVWMCPWMELKHVGTFVFGGSLAAMAVLGASPTADPEALRGTKSQK